MAAPAHRPTPHRPQRRPRLPHIVEGDPDADLKLKRRVGIFMRGNGRTNELKNPQHQTSALAGKQLEAYNGTGISH